MAKVQILGMSRRYPPDYRRRWYLVKIKDGYHVRMHGKTVQIKFANRNQALDWIGVGMVSQKDQG